MASALAPIISIPYLSNTPERCRAIAVLSAVWPPSVGRRTSLYGTVSFGGTPNDAGATPALPEVEGEAASTARGASALGHLAESGFGLRICAALRRSSARSAPAGWLVFPTGFPVSGAVPVLDFRPARRG